VKNEILLGGTVKLRLAVTERKNSTFLHGQTSVTIASAYQ